MVERLLSRKGYEPVAVLATPAAVAALEEQIPEDWPLFEASEAELSEFAGFDFHRGAIAIARRPPRPDHSLLASALAELSFPPLLVLPATRDPENLGALTRSAAAFGFGAILLGPGCPDFLSRRCLRVSMGAALDIPHAVVAEPSRFEAYAAAGYSLVGAVVEKTAVEFSEWSAPRRCAIALGDEYAGLGEEWLGLCDQRGSIAMAPGPDSLNVAAAGALFMWKAAAELRSRPERPSPV